MLITQLKNKNTLFCNFIIYRNDKVGFCYNLILQTKLIYVCLFWILLSYIKGLPITAQHIWNRYMVSCWVEYMNVDVIKRQLHPVSNFTSWFVSQNTGPSHDVLLHSRSNYSHMDTMFILLNKALLHITLKTVLVVIHH